MSAVTEPRGYALDKPLPSAAVVGGMQGLFGYQRFPVFSLPWLGRRAVVFLIPIGGLALMTSLGTWAVSQDPALGAVAGGLLFVSFMLMSFAGPGLAAIVRYLRWPLRFERSGVVLAVLLGMGISYLIDREASSRIEPMVEQGMTESGMLTEAQRVQARDLERSGVAVVINLMFLGGAYFLLGGGLALRGYFSEQRRVLDSARQAELADARLAAQQSALRLSLLQAQIAPHFLFNTLASVRALVRRDPERAEATLDALVDHLRACMPRLDTGGQLGLTTLGRELEACRSYLELMRLRLGGRLQYGIDAAEANLERALLPMLLLTLVENAVKHGIEPLPGPGRIDLRVETSNEAVRLVVEDSGAGLKPGLGGGVGLANIRAQLRDRYADAAALALSARPQGGVRAEIRLPPEEPA
ncbi:MAG: histidine kinase [Aquimonas sp.]|nr:histidine kinase [Aquimonas sp.]